MQTVPDFAGLKDALIVLGAAGLVIPLFHRLRVSPVLGFMLVGMAVGPFGLGRLVGRVPVLSFLTLRDPATIAPMAQFGVVLLLFVIGLELSFERLWVMRRVVFGLGPLQLALSAALLTGVGLAAGLAWQAAVVLGLAGAMSSTAVGLQVLAERRSLNTRFGRASFAVLLFQDLAVMPILVMIGLLGPNGAAAGGPHGLLLAGAQGLAAVAAIVGLGRLALRPLFRSVARTQSPDLFMAACLLVVIGAALAAGSAHLSMALGALIGGLLLAGTEYRRAVEITIEPFKGLLVGVFLISIGMGLDLGWVFAHPLVVLAVAGALLAVKLAVIAGLGRGFGLSWAGGAQAGLLLAPGGEFGFVILTTAAGQRLLDTATAQTALVVTALTMAAIPMLAALGGKTVQRLTPAVPIDPALLAPTDAAGSPGVIVAGFGRMGRMVGALLDRHGVAWMAIERDVDTVSRARAAGRPVYYGDVARIALLRGIGIGDAAALVVTMDDRDAVDAVVATARQERADLPIIARARDAGHAAHLYRIGASNAVPETIEASLQLGEAVLTDIGVPAGPVIVSIHETRAALQDDIRRMAPEARPQPLGRRRLRDLKRPVRSE
jgi:CPA2 family monovalent cation:H+ antiporter-2